MYLQAVGQAGSVAGRRRACTYNDRIEGRRRRTTLSDAASKAHTHTQDVHGSSCSRGKAGKLFGTFTERTSQLNQSAHYPQHGCRESVRALALKLLGRGELQGS
jgi:hypothetical protein